MKNKGLSSILYLSLVIKAYLHKATTVIVPTQQAKRKGIWSRLTTAWWQQKPFLKNLAALDSVEKRTPRSKALDTAAAVPSTQPLA